MKRFNYTMNHKADEAYMARMCHQGWAAVSLVEGVWTFEPCAPDHNATVILIELRWHFSLPENRLVQGFSAVSAHKQTPLQSNSAAGFRAFRGDCGFPLCCNR